LGIPYPRPGRSYAFVRGRELEGSYPGPPNIGTWLVMAQRVGKGWGHAPDAAWPYNPEEWPPLEPPGVDAIAKQQRTTAYSRCRTLDDCRRILAKGGGVLAAFQIDGSWIRSDGNIADPRNHAPQATHSLLLFGKDDRSEAFRFLNSWGPDWGDDGYGFLPYRYWSDRLLEAWNPDNRAVDPKMIALHSGVDVMVTRAENWAGRQNHLVEVRDFDADEILGWAVLVETSDGLEMEELFVRPAFRQMGHGRTLATAVGELRSQFQAPLKVWIPHADWPESTQQAALFNRLGLQTIPAEVRWAAACAVERTTVVASTGRKRTTKALS